MKYLILTILLFSCSGRSSDSLISISEEVIKKDRGVDIEVTPIEKSK